MLLGLWAVFLPSLYISFHTVRLPNLELMIACSTLPHNIFSACTSRLLIGLPMWWKLPRDGTARFQHFAVLAFYTYISSTQMLLDPCEQVSLVPRPIQVRSGYKANYNQSYNT